VRIGLAYNVKPTDLPEHLPEDAFEEYDSEATVDNICDALVGLGHEVRRLPADPRFLDIVRETPLDIVFNIAEGSGGRCREAHVPAVLEMLGIPYVGSDPLTLSITLDKPIAKKLVEHEGFPTPPFRTYRCANDFTEWLLSFPVIVKPAFEGSSKGVRLSSRACNFEQAKEMVRFVTDTYRQDALVEAFVPGAEVTVGILGNNPPRIAGMMEIVPKSVRQSEFVYSLEVKRDWKNQVSYRIPPALPEPVLAKIERYALGIYEALGCLDFSRIDFRLDQEGTPQFIECNPLPGLSPGYGDLPIMAESMGVSYLSLIEEILSHALIRLGISKV